MARSLLNSLSTLQIMVLFAGGSVVVAVALAIGIRKVVPDIAERQFEELADGLRVVYELLFALLLAFVIASVLDKFSEAESTVGSEATALSQMVRSNLAFPVDAQVRLNRGIGVYVDATVNDEWPAMRDGKASPDAAAALETMYALYAGFRPTADAEAEFYSQALGHLDEVATARRERLDISSSKLPTVLVLMLPLGAALLLLLEYRPRLMPCSQMVFMGTLALVVSSTYVLTIVLDYPFSGDVSVSNEPLKSGTLATLVATRPRAPQRGDRPLRLTTNALEGVWGSHAYGTILLRRRGRELRGVYRLANGTIRGAVSADGVFRGVWCEGPTRKPGSSSENSDAGLVEWRLVDTKSEGRLVTGIWSYGYERRQDGSVKPDGNWDLRKLTRDEALDLDRRLRTDPLASYCHTP
jgi:hypothetical protein